MLRGRISTGALVRRCLVLALGLLTVPLAWSSSTVPRAGLVPLSASCLLDVSRAFRVHPDILLAVLIVEGGTVGKDSRPNQNGSTDIGPFQINTVHLHRLAAMGISREELRNNGCTNAKVAAWLVTQAVADQPISTPEEYLTALANYHSRSQDKNAIYRRKLEKAFELLYSADTRR